MCFRVVFDFVFFLATVVVGFFGKKVVDCFVILGTKGLIEVNGGERGRGLETYDFEKLALDAVFPSSIFHMVCHTKYLLNCSRDHSYLRFILQNKTKN